VIFLLIDLYNSPAVKETAPLWKLRLRDLEAARKSLRLSEPGGIEALHLALRGVAVTARALGRGKIARQAKRIGRCLSALGRLEQDRRLLERIGRLGFLTPDAVAALATRWEKQSARGARRIARVADGRRIERMRRALVRLARRGRGRDIERVEQARHRAEAALARPLDGKDDGALKRYRKAVTKARFLAGDMAAFGIPIAPTQAARESAIAESLGRWSALHGLRTRLADGREEAELRGAVVLASELERLLAALEPAIASLRAGAVAASRRSANVVPLRPAASA
jgi:hypothetical protein